MTVSEENANADIAITAATASAVIRAPASAVLSAPLSSRPIGTSATRQNRKTAAALRWVWEYMARCSLGAGFVRWRRGEPIRHPPGVAPAAVGPSAQDEQRALRRLLCRPATLRN